MRRLALPFAVSTLFLLPLHADPPSPDQFPFEAPPTLDAAVILRPEFVRGPLFAVRREVPSRAGVNHYTVDSTFGTFEAKGDMELVQLIAEIQAIAKLRTISQSDTYKKALARAAQSPLRVAGNLIEHPVDTVGNVSKGLWKMVNGIGQQAKEASQGRQQSRYESSVAEDVIGFTSAKRQIAQSLGVNPYSSNEIFQQELSKVAWAAYAGQMTISGILIPVGGTVGLTLKSINAGDQTLSAVRDLSPADLRLRNLKILLAMGIERGLANAFLNNPTLSPIHQTVIVDSLATLRGVSGRDRLVKLAVDADREVEANRCQRGAQLLALINRSQPLTVLSTYRKLPIALTRDGVMVAALEWDYAIWSRESRAFVEDLRKGEIGGHKAQAAHIYLTGDASPVARAAMIANQVGLTIKSLPGPLR